MKALPANGLRGVQLREAAASEFRAVAELVTRAVKDRIYPGQDRYLDLDALYPDRAIVRRDGRVYAYPYSIGADNQVVVAEPIEVTQEFQPVTLREAVFIESIDSPDSGKWLIRVMRAGLSANFNFYPDAVLREAVGKFDGARVFEKSDAQHVQGQGKAFRQLIGGLSGARFVEGGQPDTGELHAVLTLIEPAGEVAVKLREAHARGLAGLFGFSIDADGTGKVQMREGRKVKVAQSITKVQSVDLIVEPAAGGELIRMVESVTHQEGDMLKDKLLQTIQTQAPAVYAKLDPETATDEQIETAYREAVAPKPEAKPAPTADTGIDERLRMIEARAEARAAIAGSTLPAAAKERLVSDFAARATFREADVTAAIEAERAYLAKFTESGKPAGEWGDGARAEDRAEKMAGMLDAFFDPAHKDHKAAGSFRECYSEITGDRRVTGRLEDVDRARLRESLGANFREALDSTSFASVLGDAITRRMVADYRMQTSFDIYRQLTGASVRINDFRTQERVRYGGYGDIPAVAEGADYAALTSPTDEKASYAISKHGGLESITLEMIRNDDVGVIQRLPTKLSRAAKRTLSKFVLDFLVDNPTIYDAKTLFHADHGNLGAAALDATTYAAARLAMMAQAEKDSGEPLGIGPRNLWVPAALEQAASDLFRRDTNLDATFLQSLKPNIIPVWYWTDANDWVASADQMDIPQIELGFLDGNEEPELFVQDNPTVGSLFTSDKITYKLRHVYGAAVIDYRGLYKALVA